MKTVVGLGNPGKQYDGSPHNAGFAVVEELAGILGCRLARSIRFHARLGEAALGGGGPVLLVEPLTYMNNSGAAVAPILRYRNVQPADLVLVLDDADLEFGRLRVRARGSSGGHRGLESVIQQVGTSEFARVRLGVGRDPGGRGLVEHVLGPLAGDARRQMADMVATAARAVLCLLEEGVDAAMNRFNKGPAGQAAGGAEPKPET